MKTNNKQKAFTLIELLVVVAILGMLMSVILLSLGHSRMRARDAKRLAEMNQARVGLDLYYSSAGGYPDPAAWLAAESSNTALVCSGTSTFRPPHDGLIGYNYVYDTSGATYIGCGTDTVWTTYKIRFITEAETDVGPAGTYYMSPKGFTTVAPF